MGATEIDIDLAQIKTDIAAAIALNAPGNIPVDYIDDCFQIKTKNNCDILFVGDLTDYAGLPGINVGLSFIYASLWLVGGSCGNACNETLIVAETQYVPGSSWNYLDLTEGCYEVRIRLDYDVTVNLINYPNTIKELVLKQTLNCCPQDVENLKHELVSKIAQVSCTIKDYGYIGRNSHSLLINQYKLQAILWALKSCYINCKDFLIFKCSADKIITNCNC